MKMNAQYRKLMISTLITAGILIFSLTVGLSVSMETLINRLFVPMLRLLGFITLGLVVGQIIESTGWTKYLAILARPFFRFSRLGDRCSAAFSSAFISGVISNAMLLEFYQEQRISKVQLFLTNYLNQLPAFFLHLPTTFFIVVPLTGTAGVLYFLLTFLATILRAVIVLIGGHLFLTAQTDGADSSHADNSIEVRSADPKPAHKKGPIFDQIKRKLPNRVISIAIFVLPIYTLVFALNTNGFFLYLNESLSDHLRLDFIPVESLSVIMLSFAAEFTSGFAAAGALMHAGVLSTKQTVIALLLGNITAFPIRALRHQLPRYMGIFSPGMGLQLLLSGQVFRVVSLVVVGITYYVVA